MDGNVCQTRPHVVLNDWEEVAAPFKAPLAATTDQFQFSFIAAEPKLLAQGAVLGPVDHLAPRLLA